MSTLTALSSSPKPFPTTAVFQRHTHLVIIPIPTWSKPHFHSPYTPSKNSYTQPKYSPQTPTEKHRPKLSTVVLAHTAIPPSWITILKVPTHSDSPMQSHQHTQIRTTLFSRMILAGTVNVRAVTWSWKKLSRSVVPCCFIGRCVDRREGQEVHRLVKALTVLLGHVLILERGGDAV